MYILFEYNGDVVGIYSSREFAEMAIQKELLLWEGDPYGAENLFEIEGPFVVDE